MQFVFAPVLGGLSDRFGRRPVILMSLLGAAASYLLSGLAPALWWLFIGRVISGITGASFSCAGAYVADVTPPEKRAASFGLVGAVFGLGFILGPALGGILGDVGLRFPYFVGRGPQCAKPPLRALRPAGVAAAREAPSLLLRTRQPARVADGSSAAIPSSSASRGR